MATNYDNHESQFEETNVQSVPHTVGFSELNSWRRTKEEINGVPQHSFRPNWVNVPCWLRLWQTQSTETTTSHWHFILNIGYFQPKTRHSRHQLLDTMLFGSHSVTVHQWEKPQQIGTGLTAHVSLKSKISTPLLGLINTTLIPRSLYLNCQAAPLYGLLSLVTNTLVRVKHRVEVEAGHPLVISWLLVLPKAAVPPPLVTFWPFPAWWNVNKSKRRMARMVHCVFNFGHTLPMSPPAPPSPPPPPLLLCWCQKQ